MWFETLFRKTPVLPTDLDETVKAYFLQQLPNKKTPICDLRFVVFDTETTGLEEKKGDRLLSIGAVGMKGCRVDLNDTFYAVVNPDNHFAPAETVKVHFITPSETIAAPSIEEVLPKFLDFIKADVLVAHHALFDIGFIGSEMKRLYGRPLINYFTDTVELAHAVDSAEQSSQYLLLNPHRMEEYELDKLCEKFHIPNETRHHALGDAFVTAQIAARVFKQFDKIGVKTLQDLLLLRRV